MKKNSKLLRKFKRKWEQIRLIEEGELHKLSLRQKLHQTATLMYLGRGLRVDFDRDKETLKVRSRWVLLKKKLQ